MGTLSGSPVGDHRRLRDLLLELRGRGGDPSLRKINSASGVSVGHLSEIFAGKTAPGPDVAVKIAQALRATDQEQARVRFYAEGVEADRSTQRAGNPRRAGWEGCPYLGLPAFEERHARIFYGRRALTGRLLDRLREHPRDAGVLLVLGPSGAGKSSLLQAGLMGSLAGDALVPGCQFWPRRVLTPTNDPVRQLAIHLADLAGSDAISVHEALTASPDQAHLLTAQALAAAGPAAGEDPRLVVVVDQLEELFTLATDPAEQQRFLTALHSMATMPAGSPGALIVAGIRGDFLDQAMAFPAVRQAAEAGVFAVGVMSESELREAIVGPAAEAGIRIPDDVCAAILDDLREHSLPVGYDSGALPLLSQVMFVMWQTGVPAELTLQGYHRTGGVADIVRTSADHVYLGLDPDRQNLTRRIFTHLTAVTDGRLTRRPSTRAALRTAAGGDEADLVVEAFAAQRLLTVADNDLVTIAHEELLRSWDRLRDWLQPSLTDQALHRALTDDVQDWQQGHRDPSYLYHGGRLLAVDDAVRRWAGDPGQHLTLDPVTLEFLHAGHRRARRRRRLYQAFAAVMIMLLAVTGTAAVLATRNAARADRQHAIALSRQLAALSRTTSTTDRATSEQLAAAALHVAETEEAHAAASDLLADHQGTLPGSAVVAFSPDGKLLATAHGTTVRLWDPATGRPVGAPLTGHTDLMLTLRFSPDGRLLATGGFDTTVRLWDPATGRPSGTPLTGHAGPVRLVRFSPDGKLLATADTDGVVRLWDPATGRTAGTLKTDQTGRGARSVAFSPGGKLLATSDDYGDVRLWDPATGRPAGTMRTGQGGSAPAVQFSPDGRLLATMGQEGTLRLWEPATRRPVWTPPASRTGPVSAVAFSPDGKLLATGDQDGVVRLWDPATGRPVGTPLAGHTEAVSAVVFSPAGSQLATSDGGTVRLWDPATGRPVGAPLAGHAEGVSVVVYSPDGKLLATAGGFEHLTTRLWDAVTGRPADGQLTGPSEPVWAVRFSPDGKLLVAADNGVVRLWDPATRRPIGTLPTGSLSSVAFSPDGKMLATTGNEALRLWDPATRRPIGTLPTGSLSSVAFSPDGRTLATAGNATVRLWDPATRRPIGAPHTGHTAEVSAVAFSPGGKLLATASYDKTVRLWDPATGVPAGTLAGHTEPVSRMVFSPDGKLLASAGDGTSGEEAVRLWDPATGRPVGTPLTGHTSGVSAIVFSPDGKLLATGSERAVRLWDPAAGRQVSTLQVPGTERVTGVVFSPDGTMLATADTKGGAVRLWDPATGRPVGVPLTGHTKPVTEMAFSPDGKLLATASQDGTARLWDPSIFRDPMAYLCDRSGNLSEAEWHRYAADEPVIKVCAG